jgi:DNA-binding NarL/FixJ family response regulator
MRFLIVDDTPDVRAAVRELLEKRGHVVLAEAGDGPGAMSAAARFEPDAVFLDVSLGNESGFDVARALTTAWPELPVVLLSVDTRASPELVAACGARGMVSKTRLHAVDIDALFQD